MTHLRAELDKLLEEWLLALCFDPFTEWMSNTCKGLRNRLVAWVERRDKQIRRQALEDAAKLVCPSCRKISFPEAKPVYTNKPKPVRWIHEEIADPRDPLYCIAQQVHDLLEMEMEAEK